MKYISSSIRQTVFIEILQMYELIVDLIEKSKLSINEIAKGADVEPRWLRMIANKEIKNPGIQGLESVKKFLSK